jgi:hypothetical protein
MNECGRIGHSSRSFSNCSFNQCTDLDPPLSDLLRLDAEDSPEFRLEWRGVANECVGVFSLVPSFPGGVWGMIRVTLGPNALFGTLRSSVDLRIRIEGTGFVGGGIGGSVTASCSAASATSPRDASSLVRISAVYVFVRMSSSFTILCFTYSRLFDYLFLFNDFCVVLFRSYKVQ